MILGQFHTLVMFFILVFFKTLFFCNHVEGDDYWDAILAGKAPCAKVLSSYTIKLINLMMMLMEMMLMMRI